MRKITDLTGEKFGNLTVLNLIKDKNNLSKWSCKCDCGQTTEVFPGNLVAGNVKSCGCLQRQRTSQRHLNKRINEIGKKYSNCEVLECFVIHDRLKRTTNTKARVKCYCGEIFECRLQHLKSLSIKSCGCLLKLPYSEAAMNLLYNKYQSKSKIRKIDFRLTVEQFKNLTLQNCFYCAIEPKQISKQNYCNGIYIYNGIDRIDNSKGYVFENCIPCCKNCNTAKGSMNIDNMIKILKFLKITI